MSTLSGPAADSPWHRPILVAVLAANALGAILVVIGWWGGSRQVTVGRQAGWTDLAAAGVLLAAGADARWLMAGRRAVRGRGQALLRSHPARELAPLIAPMQAAAFVALPGMERYHRADCRLVAGKASASGSRDVHEEAGHQPCGVCRP